MKNISTKQGFSLVETLIAVAIFTIASVALTGAFSGFLKTYNNAKKAQRNAESAQYAINLMAKTIRSSTLNAGSFGPATDLILFDNAAVLPAEACVMYRFSGGIIEVSKRNGNNIADCVGFGTFSPLTTTGEIAGLNFYGEASVAGSNIGKVLIAVEILGTSNNMIQTTVSLRQ